MNKNIQDQTQAELVLNKYPPLQREIIYAVANMDVDKLEKVIHAEVKLTGMIDDHRDAFFKLLREKFKTVKKRGVKKYKISISFCDNCYCHKEVICFKESYQSGFALAFEAIDDKINAIRICQSAGILKENLEQHSHFSFSYFN